MADKHVSLGYLRSIRAAMATYRDAVDELEHSNWNGDLGDALRRMAALQRIANNCTTDELEALAGLPREA